MTEQSDNADEPQIPRIGRQSDQRRTYHGPVDVRLVQKDLGLVGFTGSEESDVLHAAGAWMAEHPNAMLLGINWYGDFIYPHDVDHEGPPLHRLDLTVDLTLEPEVAADMGTSGI